MNLTRVSVSIGVALALFALAPRPNVAHAQERPADQQLARAIFQQLIEIDTTHASTAAANAMAERLRRAGFLAADLQIVGPHADKQNLVARLRGTGKSKPLLLIAHLDVVAALRSDWSMEPFRLQEKEGFFYGRGTSDDKSMAALFIANLIRLKREGYRGERDIIVALTADEEGGTHNGIDWLLRRRRSLIDAEFAINEGGGGLIRNGKYIANAVQASEKLYQSYRLESKHPGGHSSMPAADNAIYRLAAGLDRLGKFQFPILLNEVTRTYFERMAALESGQVAADMRALVSAGGSQAAGDRLSTSPYHNALLRTTCVATQLSGGHAENALPQTATAVVNCRVLPSVHPRSIEKQLAAVLADPAIRLTPIGVPTFSTPSPLRPDVMAAVERITESMWPGIPVVPAMMTGATDSLYLRNADIPTYGISGLFQDVDDVRDHGKDERILVKSFYESQEFLYRLVVALGN